MPDKLPVIIAARNEAEWLSHTLSALPSSDVEPVVVPNGCKDNTADIAESFGVNVLKCPEEGKMQAMQVGIRFLGKRALDPFVTLDADAWPLFPGRWAAQMLKDRARVDTDCPAVAIGPTVYRGKGLGSLARTVRLFMKQYENRFDNERGFFCGRNMLIHPVKPDVVDGLLSLGRLWYGEDRALKNVVVKHGGNVYRSSNLFGAVVSDGTRLPGVGAMLSRSLREKGRLQVVQSYLAEAPPGSVPYEPSVVANIPEQLRGRLTEPAKN